MYNYADDETSETTANCEVRKMLMSYGYDSATFETWEDLLEFDNVGGTLTRHEMEIDGAQTAVVDLSWNIEWSDTKDDQWLNDGKLKGKDFPTIIAYAKTFGYTGSNAKAEPHSSTTRNGQTVKFSGALAMTMGTIGGLSAIATSLF
jgi:hypothetical protein